MTAMTPEIQAIVSALEPFAKAADRINPKVADATNLWPGHPFWDGSLPVVNASDFRRASRAIAALKAAPTSDGGGELEWLVDRDNLILANGTQADGWWEVRRGSVKGEVRGRGPTPRQALQAAMLADAGDVFPTAPSAAPVGDLRDGLLVAHGIVEADLEQAKETGDADWIGQSREALAALDTALAATPVPVDAATVEACARIADMHDHRGDIGKAIRALAAAPKAADLQTGEGK